MSATHEERRQEPRVATCGLQARLRLGHRMAVIDVSARGALIEGGSPLRPGARIELQVEADGRRERLVARVTRCGVVAVDPECGLTYRAALAFAESCEWLRELSTRDG